MAVAERPNNNKARKDANPSGTNGPRRGAWQGGPSNAARFNQNYQPQMNQNRNSGPPLNSHNFPPPSGPQPHDRPLQGLDSAVGKVVLITTRNGAKHEGVLSTIEPDSMGIMLHNARDPLHSNLPPQPTLFLPFVQLANWQPAPLPPPTPISNGNGNGAQKPAFRTDTDISRNGPAPRERELQAWSDESTSTLGPPLFSKAGDDDTTFGPNASTGPQWDQFAANKQMFGVTTTFNEEVYTTKLDRSRPDYKERERHAIQLANEIQNTTTNNSHIAEERGLVDDSGINEEDKYGAVVRGPNSYVPPGARRNGVPAPAPTSTPAAPKGSASTIVAPEVPQVSVNGPDGNKVTPAPSPKPSSAKPAAENNLVGTFRDFVTNEKQRLAQKKHAIAKKEMDNRIADLQRFSKEFKLNRPIPSDLIPILAKDEQKQKAIAQKSTADAEATGARAIGFSSTPSPPGQSQSRVPLTFPAPASKPQDATPSTQHSKPIAAVSTATPASGQATNAKPTSSSSQPTKKDSPPPNRPAIQMFIQKIPPFRKSGATTNSTPSSELPSNVNNRDTQGTPASPTASVGSSASAVLRLSVNANPFRPNPNASVFKPGGPTGAPGSPSHMSPKSRTDGKVESPAPPNPFFGPRVFKKTMVHIKDDFNPFKHAKVAEASAVAPQWPYNGKRYMQMFPSLHHPQPIAAMPGQGLPFEEDHAAQAAARGGYPVMYAAYPYQYPGQPPQQMIPVPTSAPPGGYMQPYMSQIPYPPHQPNGPLLSPTAMYGPPMGGMPPSQGYMPPPPPSYPPNGGGPGPRGSIPPSSMPPHGYPYHQSPQLSHAVPYQMMMQPPAPGAPPHPYDGQGGANGH